jgi:serine/threonine protein kinase
MTIHSGKDLLELDTAWSIILEYADGGNLQEYINFMQDNDAQMGENEVLLIFIQIVKGLSALHKKRVIHRDLTVIQNNFWHLQSANIFMTMDRRIKIGDLNLAKVLKGQFG